MPFFRHFYLSSDSLVTMDTGSAYKMAARSGIDEKASERGKEDNRVSIQYNIIHLDFYNL